jgi:hypothetical protein
MAYVPGFDTDLFLSYARGDGEEWVGALEESLARELTSRLGEVQIWRDEKNIRFGQDWPQELRPSIAVASSNIRADRSRSDAQPASISAEIRRCVDRYRHAPGVRNRFAVLARS